MLHRLEAAHRTAELGALLHVFHRHIQYRIGAAHHLHTLGGYAPLHRPPDNGPALVHRSDN